MAINKYMLFFTPMCPKCPKVKEYMDENTALEKEWVNAGTKEGLELARKYNIMAVPTVIFFDSGEEVARATSVEEAKRVIENKSLGDM